MRSAPWDRAVHLWKASAAARLSVGRLLLLGALFVIGLLSLATGEFAYSWQPVRDDFPDRAVLARALGLLLALGAGGALFERTARLAIVLLAAVVSGWLIVLQGTRLATAPIMAGAWSSFSEIGTLAIAAWLLLCRPVRELYGWRIYGIFPLMFALAHFVFPAITASLVPRWIPHPLFWAYLTGALHLTGGLLILAGVGWDVAAAGLGLMYLSWVVILHVPRVAAAPGSRFEWTMLLFAAGISGSALVLSAAVHPRDAGRSRYKRLDDDRFDRWRGLRRFWLKLAGVRTG